VRRPLGPAHDRSAPSGRRLQNGIDGSTLETWPSHLLGVLLAEAGQQMWCAVDVADDWGAPEDGL
jgi:hypothetical protein